jgi:predicted acyl esterase
MRLVGINGTAGQTPGNIFAAGHRIRISAASKRFPHFIAIGGAERRQSWIA